jgi:TonB family protein
MTYKTTPIFERETFYKMSLPAVTALSILLHVIMLIIVPVLSSIFHSSKKFERPKTFQLVASPLRPMPVPRVPVKDNAQRQRMPQEQKEAMPRQTPDSQTPRRQREAQKQQDAARPIRENLDELSSILDEIPAPAQIAAVGNFKYHWYLNNVQQKLERYWNPTSENRSIKVVVSFTIDKNGAISEPSIRSSSGNSTIDNLALRAVKLAAPFGRLPPGFEGDRLDLNCTLIPTRK